MNSPNTPESIVLYTPAIPCSGTAGILALLLPSPAHGKKEERASPFRPPSCLLSPPRGKRPSMYDAKAFGPFAFLAYEKSGTGGSIPPSLRLAFPAHEGNGHSSSRRSRASTCFPRARGKWFGFTCITVAGNCFPRAPRNMGKAREATPEKPRFPHIPGTAEWPILFGWGRLSHAGRMMPPPPPYSEPARPGPRARHDPQTGGRIGRAGIFCLFTGSGLHYCPSLEPERMRRVPHFILRYIYALESMVHPHSERSPGRR